MENLEKRKIINFKDLGTWREGHQLVLMVYQLSKKFPKDELFGLTNQIRRAAVSITSNIAEGFGRTSAKEKYQFYSVARGSITEVQNQLTIAKDVGYLTGEEFQKAEVQADLIHKITTGLLKSTRLLSLLAIFYLLSSIFCISSANAAATLAAPNTNALSSGLVGYWPLDGVDTDWTTDTALDLSGQGNTGSLVGMSTSSSPTAGVVGQALQFRSSYISVADNPTLDMSGSFTISAHVKANSLSMIDLWRGIVTKGGDGESAANNHNYLLGYSQTFGGTGWSFVVENAAGSNCNLVGSKAETGVWYDITAVFDKDAHKMYLYVDGQLQNSVSCNLIANINALPMVIGSDNDDPSGDAWNGIIDDVRMYNRALSSTQVALLYAAGQAHVGSVAKNALTSGLVVHWSMDGSDTHWDTGTEDDISDSGNTGFFTGMSTTSSPVPGKIGQGLTLTGGSGAANNGVATVSSAANALTSVTTSLWFKPGASWNPGGDVFLRGSDGGGGFTLAANRFGTLSSFKLDFTVATSSWNTSSNCESASATLLQGNWYLLTATYDQSSTEFYINGQNVGSCPASGPIVYRFGIPSLALGYSGAYTPYGAADDIRFYNRALSAQEVAQLYADGAATIGHSPTGANAPLSKGLVGYWTMDGPTTHWDTGTEDDASGNSHTGSFISLSTTTAPTAGKIGQALYFNGSDSRIDVAGTINALQSFTASAWIKPQTLPTRMDFINIGDIYFNLQSGKPSIYVNGVSSAYMQASAIPTNTYSLVTATWNGTTLKLYTNGVLSASQSLAGTATRACSGRDAIGVLSAAGGCSMYINYFQGAIDDVRLYDRALSASEVSQLYHLSH